MTEHAADPLRVLHLTDPHLFADRHGSLRGTPTYATLSRALDHYRKSGWHADLIALTGDLVQDDSAGAYEHCRDLLMPLNLPVHCVPGNHDVPSLMRDILPSPPFHYCDSTVVGNWLIVGIDSCCAGRAGGMVTDAEFRRLDELIAGSRAANVMICLHHPPVMMGSAWLDTVGLDNGEDFLAHIEAIGTVRLAIFGHVHQAYDAKHGNTRIIGTPSTCRQFLPGSEYFAVDDSPPAYRRISLNSDGSFDSRLVWLDDA